MRTDNRDAINRVERHGIELAKHAKVMLDAADGSQPWHDEMTRQGREQLGLARDIQTAVDLAREYLRERCQ